MTSTATVPRIIGTIIILLILNSCIGNTVQHQFRHLSREGWNRNDTITFDLPLIRRDGAHVIDTEIRVNPPFHYRQVWIAREVVLKVPLTTHRDTICINTEDMGGPGSRTGVTIQVYSHCDTSLILTEGQSGSIRMYHIMSKEILPNITDIGIRVRSIQ